MKPELPAAVVHVPPSRWRVWSTAIRPRTLPLAATPVLVGVGIAWAEVAAIQWLVAAATLLTALLIQIGTNLHNDAADFERGNDQPGRIGPLRVTAAGWASAASVRRAAHLAFGGAFLLGIYLAIAGGWPIVAIGVGSLVAGVGYSGGRRPISHTPFGELFVWVFFGVLAVAGSHWLQAGRWSVAALLAGAALGLPAAAVLLANNLRDVETDCAAGRRTLAAYLGDRGARNLYAAIMVLPFAALPLLAHQLSGHAALWLGLAALPSSVHVIHRMRSAEGVALNGVLAATARAQFVFGLLLTIGCVA